MKIEIRRPKNHEAKILSDLSMRSKRSNGYDDAFMQACREELTVSEADLQQNEYWVADANAICGCVCLVTNSKDQTGEIEAFFIDPDWQRKGIGRLLWDKIVLRTNELGLKQLFLDADPNAEDFYQAMGFTTIGKNPSASIPGRFLPRMAIDLEKHEGGKIGHP